MRTTFGRLSGLWLGMLAALPASAMPLAPTPLPDTPIATRVAQGCGPGAWRGPCGHCRDTPYHGRLPGGGWR
ncbi:hypothetical protein QOZ99_000797 [Angulomicrobium amanitiforme]|uniref:Uncharacterized protein n=1 Tax=Ancylobacter amanitiformis TaxID=217069 RepID=A0ABU0LMI9_9HYPH|nr:hypothetical protein [Ancylobacter amanitiformis]